MAKRIHLDFWGDIACPWCFIGHRRLQRALKSAPDVEVRLRAYQLMPELPPQGIPDAKGYFEKKFGGAARVKAMFAQVHDASQGDGIAFDLDRQRITNTKLAHRAVSLAQREGQGAQ